MAESVSNNKRIAKNTMLLYVRMILVMLVSLYTSRILLVALGITDYGIYNVVGGVVAMFTFMSSALGNASSRYITIALGKGDPTYVQKVFSAALIIHWGIAIVIMLLAEVIGVWFLNTKMDIPTTQLVAANWVLQFSILATFITVISVPYNAMIIAHERMGVYAVISIVDVILKLGIVYLLMGSSVNRLILYGAGILVVQMIDRLVYGIYCKSHFAETKFIMVRDKQLFAGMLSFSGYSLIGNLAVVGSTQGLNLVLNLFFGPTVNAARGIAIQIQGAVKAFITNFLTAANPQITKSYAVEDFSRLKVLIFIVSRLAFYLMLFLSLPILLQTNTILTIWLVEVPEYTAIFIRLILLMSLIDCLERPLNTALNATGQIRVFQLTAAVCMLTVLPVAYICLRLGAPPQSVFIVSLIATFLHFLIELLIVAPKISISIREHLVQVLGRAVLVGLLSFSVSFVFSQALEDNILNSFLVMVFSMLCVAVFSLFVGLSPSERLHLLQKIPWFKRCGLSRC